MTPQVSRDQTVVVRFRYRGSEVEERFTVTDTTPPWLEFGRTDAGVIPESDTIVDILIAGSHVRATVQRTTEAAFSVLRPVFVELAPEDINHSWHRPRQEQEEGVEPRVADEAPDRSEAGK